MSILDRNPVLVLAWERLIHRLNGGYWAELNSFDDIYEKYDIGWERFTFHES